ncbi:MAG TPA: PIG-L deacetylase family protein [Pleomorphomonadaceae bacterium]|nr:PIG-L deacetylase family protein [Pleomorphomonadaceae bacterium]
MPATPQYPVALDRVLAARNILIVGAHPDDPDAFAAGTVWRWTQAGARVRYLVVTSGDKGVPDEELGDPARFIAERETEQRASAAYLGADEVIFLRERDGEVFDTLDLRDRIVREIRRMKADLVLTHDPLTRMFRQHPDHRAVGFATLAAVFPSCRLASFFPAHQAEGLEPHTVHMLLLAGGTENNLWVDIADSFERKIEALELHASQASAFVGGVRSRMGLRAAQMGEQAGLELAEAFAYVWLD